MEELGMTAGEFAEAFKSPAVKNEKESREYIESFYDKADVAETPGQYKEATIDECIKSLDCLFKSYKNDSEFNYQLNVRNSPWNLLKKYITEAGLLTIQNLDNRKSDEFLKASYSNYRNKEWENRYAAFSKMTNEIEDSNISKKYDLEEL